MTWTEPTPSVAEARWWGGGVWREGSQGTQARATCPSWCPGQKVVLTGRPEPQIVGEGRLQPGPAEHGDLRQVLSQSILE